MEEICKQGRHRSRSPKFSACWRRPAKAACAILYRRSIRPSPAAEAKLDAVEVRGCSACFRSIRWAGDAGAGRARFAAMLDLVMELEQNGRSLQHFCRELARYFRNLLVRRWRARARV
jgi:hypothetical protein